jgi:glycosyltransferase involved in cell wall biosynthesis
VDGFEVRHPRIPILPGGHLFSLSGLFLYLQCRPIVRDYLQNGRIDLIHAHTIMPDGFAAVLLGRDFNIPVVCTVHGSDVKIAPWKSRTTRLTTKWALRRVNRLIVVSEDLTKAVSRLVKNRETCVARNGADPDRFKQIAKFEARSQLGLPMKKKIVLFVGNLFSVKGVGYLLKAISLLSARDVLLYLLGDGYLKEELCNDAIRLGIADVCFFMKQRPHEEIPLWLSAADCFVLPSLSEGLPTVLPEAMMCGTPVVATAVGGTPEIITHRENGLLVQPKDPEALAQAIAEILKGTEDVKAMTAKAMRNAHANLTWEHNAEQTFDVYRQVLGSDRKDSIESSNDQVGMHL